MILKLLLLHKLDGLIVGDNMAIWYQHTMNTVEQLCVNIDL